MSTFVPSSLPTVLEMLRPVFTGPSFATMTALVTGVLAGPGARTVTGMWGAAGLAGRSHWSRAHEQTIKDGKDLLGAGDNQSRLPMAVERTTAFVLANITILVLWYHHAGHAEGDLAARRRRAPWYRHKRHVSLEDMIIAFWQARITSITAAQPRPELFDPDATTSEAAAA
jgi:hypothetical protein